MAMRIVPVHGAVADGSLKSAQGAGGRGQAQIKGSAPGAVERGEQERDAKYLHGYIDRTGKTVIPPRFNIADPFSEGRARVEINAKFGYIDKEGEVVIEVSAHGDFSEGLAVVQSEEGLWGAIDQSGNWVVTPKFNQLYNFSQGLAQALELGYGQGYGFINKNGDWVIPPQFGDVRHFSEDLAAVQIESGWGYIDQNGSVVIPPRFRSATPFREGLAKVRGEMGAAFIDKEGKLVIQERRSFHFSTNQVSGFSDGRAMFLTTPEWADESLVGFMDRTGKVVIPPQFNHVCQFSEGLAAVGLTDRKLGFIDLSGKLVIQTQFEFTENFFSEGLAGVLEVVHLPWGTIKIWGFIDKTGKIVIKPQFKGAQRFSEGLAPVIF
jgi:WG containing repeat